MVIWIILSESSKARSEDEKESQNPKNVLSRAAKACTCRKGKAEMRTVKEHQTEVRAEGVKQARWKPNAP